MNKWYLREAPPNSPFIVLESLAFIGCFIGIFITHFDKVIIYFTLSFSGILIADLCALFPDDINAKNKSFNKVSLIFWFGIVWFLLWAIMAFTERI